VEEHKNVVFFNHLFHTTILFLLQTYTNSTLHDYRLSCELCKQAGEMVEREAGHWMDGKKWGHWAWRKYLNVTRSLQELIAKICEKME